MKSRAPARSLEADLTIDPEWTARLLEDFLRTEIHRTGLRRAVLGLSGGLDSAVVAHLAARALGRAAVTAVLMPYRASSPSSIGHAEEVVGQLGIVAEKVDITPMVDGFLAAAGRVNAHRLGNVMARARMIVLYDRSAEPRGLVIGTSNKTELLLGYGTLHGDLASALNPIGDLYKTQVRALAAWLGVPKVILDKAPSADLRPDQSDEEDLGMSYEEADRVLALRVDSRIERDDVIKMGYRAALVDKIDALVVRSQFKRRLPLLAKVSTRSIGWDFRYPRDWKS